MHDPTPLTPRQRVLRLVGGIAFILGGIVVFQVSSRLDPANRAAIVAIVMIVIGTGWLGQAARGQIEGGVVREHPSLPGPRVSVERTGIGFVAAWLLPGAGHWMIGRRKKAILYFGAITLTFLTGLLLAKGRNFNYERDSVYFLAYMFNGLETLIAWAATSGLERTEPIRFYHLGFLYSSVASLLNVVAMMDFLATCSRSGHATRIAHRHPAAPGTEEAPGEAS
jgi:hypothetical protein